MPKPATRQDVALAAGVSGATVSRVYNLPHLVDAATAARVRAAAQTLGFVPDKNASALRRRTSGTLLFVEIEGGQGYRWPSQRAYQSLYGEIIRAVIHSAQKSPYTLQLVSLDSPKEIPSLGSARDFDGVLGFDVTDPESANALAALGRPVVCCHHGDHLVGVSTVATDNRLGGVLQARHLAALGHSRIAYLTGLRDEVRSHRLRWQGFASAAAPDIVLEGVVGFVEGRLAAGRLAAQIRSGVISAIACVNDLTAFGVVQGLLAEGLNVPRDVVVIGYDNLVLNGLLGPWLPTIDARLPLIYTRALEVLAAQASGSGSPEEVHELVDPVLHLTA